jgi:hypothetical protein
MGIPHDSEQDDNALEHIVDGISPPACIRRREITAAQWTRFIAEGGGVFGSICS